MQKIRKGDTVIVITGKDKGRSGKVVRVLPEIHKVVIEGINIVKKSVKPNPRLDKPGGLIEKEAAIDVSNVAIQNPVSGKADRISFKVTNDGKKNRCYKSNGEMIDI